MGMEIPAPKEEEESDQFRGMASFVNLSTESEQNRATEEDDEEEEEEEEDGELVEAAEGNEQHGGRRQEEEQRTTNEAREMRALKARPSVLVVGLPGVGKRSLVSRLIARGRSTKVTSETGAIGHGWTVSTKYYTANVSIWTAPLDHPALEDITSVNVEFGRCEALVMVFDSSNPTSFEQLRQWATGMDLDNFEIRLCIGNKADRVPEHFAHTEYRRKLQRKGESTTDPHPEFWDFGINRTEGSSLLDDEGESAEDRRRSCIEWCSDNCFEYIEACAIDEVFDECITVDDDLQGVARIEGALTAHIWPGLAMKDGTEGNDAAQSSQEQDITSDDDSDYYIEYELLSNGSAEPWEASGWEEQWSFSPHVDESTTESSNGLGASSTTTDTEPHVQSNDHKHDDHTVTTALSQASKESVADVAPFPEAQTRRAEIPSDEPVDHPVRVQIGSGEKEGLCFDEPSPKGHKVEEWEDMERLMSEMANMRSSMRSMSDQHRRETAAQLALRMASMFKDDESGESDFE